MEGNDEGLLSFELLEFGDDRVIFFLHSLKQVIFGSFLFALGLLLGLLSLFECLLKFLELFLQLGVRISRHRFNKLKFTLFNSELTFFKTNFNF